MSPQPRRIVFLASDNDPAGPAWFVPTLVAGLPADQFSPAVGVFGRSVGGLGERIAADAPNCPVFPLTHGVRLNDWRSFGRIVFDEYGPGLIHAVGPFAARVSYLHTGLPVGRRANPPGVIVSGVDDLGADATAWLTRRAVRAADRVVATTTAEAERYRADGVDPDRVVIVPPFPPPVETVLDPAAFRKELDIPPDSRLVVAAGRFDATAGLKTAVWAFDVVKYVAPDLFLVLVGDGPDRDKLVRFGRSLGFDDYRIRFVRPPVDPAAVMALADIVWVTHVRGGVREALAALAAGRPLIAARNPDLAEIIALGETDRMIPPGDRVALAAVTNEILAHPGGAVGTAEAARKRVVDEFSANRFVQRLAGVYHSMTSTPPNP